MTEQPNDPQPASEYEAPEITAIGSLDDVTRGPAVPDNSSVVDAG